MRMYVVPDKKSITLSKVINDNLSATFGASVVNKLTEILSGKQPCSFYRKKFDTFADCLHHQDQY
ncbi:hypothetical protein B7P43_G11384 [Cryptotermes secundus]|uniref:Uncharacterized protein n=1 Tax=Cryptotermes secundus TaxID=105785 RepID=A0A2J7QXF0_9NEOP|nr:hypothetical protein B7P43_G11384 [Cryptotermes secundus]